MVRRTRSCSSSSSTSSSLSTMTHHCCSRRARTSWRPRATRRPLNSAHSSTICRGRSKAWCAPWRREKTGYRPSSWLAAPALVGATRPVRLGSGSGSGSAFQATVVSVSSLLLRLSALAKALVEEAIGLRDFKRVRLDMVDRVDDWLVSVSCFAEESTDSLGVCISPGPSSRARVRYAARVPRHWSVSVSALHTSLSPLYLVLTVSI